MAPVTVRKAARSSHSVHRMEGSGMNEIQSAVRPSSLNESIDSPDWGDPALSSQSKTRPAGIR